MSAEPQPLAGTDRIRSIKDEDAVFRAFDSYPWNKDKTFMVLTPPRNSTKVYTD